MRALSSRFPDCLLAQLRAVHKEARMVLHASQHRPSTQDHSSYLHSHDRHYIRNNCEAACHSARFVRHEKELAALQQKAAIEIYSVGAN